MDFILTVCCLSGSVVEEQIKKFFNPVKIVPKTEESEDTLYSFSVKHGYTVDKNKITVEGSCPSD